ncbi:MAG: hypothetical protein KJ737_12345 [Proteobacteria bacterium]|nr:hypothetical protein [Pseudomonadota bacterium]
MTNIGQAIPRFGVQDAIAMKSLAFKPMFVITNESFHPDHGGFHFNNLKVREKINLFL